MPAKPQPGSPAQHPQIEESLLLFCHVAESGVTVTPNRCHIH